MGGYWPIAIVWGIEIAWGVSYVRRYRVWQRLRREAEARPGGMGGLDLRTIVAAFAPERIAPDEAWTDAFFAYHLPAGVVVRLAMGPYYPFHQRGWRQVAAASALTAVGYSAVAWWLFGPRG